METLSNDFSNVKRPSDWLDPRESDEEEAHQAKSSLGMGGFSYVGG